MIFWKILNNLVLTLLLLPLLATAQLKEFEVIEMERPDVSVVQGNTQWPDDALLLVYSSLKDLNFRSSLGAIDKVSYNTQLNRYEVLFKSQKQILLVYASNFIQHKIETFNPNPKDVFYYKVEEKKHEIVSIEPGTLEIFTEPIGAVVFVNGNEMVQKTPFTGQHSPGMIPVKLQKAKHETIDTTVAVRSGEPTFLNVQMKPTTLWVNISSTPSGASVTLDGTSLGTTPASFEMDLTDKTKRGSKQLQLTLSDYESISTTIELWPSSAPQDLNYLLSKEKGNFSITSTPEGAQVFIGGKYRGTTPLQGSMEVGKYDVKLKLDGYMLPKQSMEVKTSSPSKLDFAMRDRSIFPVATGQAFGGGIVFELREDGHGLIVAMEDLGIWKRAKAGRLCKDFLGGGYSGWHIPRLSELKKLNNVLALIDSALLAEGGEIIEKSRHWTKTVVGTGYWETFDFNRSANPVTSLGSFFDELNVRPVRAF
jgi:hypothetical protein